MSTFSLKTVDYMWNDQNFPSRLDRREMGHEDKIDSSTGLKNDCLGLASITV